MVLLLYLAIIAVLGLAYLHLQFTYWKRRGIPQNTQWTILGDLWDVGLKYHFLDKANVLYKKFKGKSPFFGLYAMTNPTAVVTDPDLLRRILVKDFANFPNRGLFHSEKNDVLTTNLLNIENEAWKKKRNALSPTFTSGKIKAMFPIIEEKTQEMLEYLQKNAYKGPIETKEVSSRLTADVVSATSFGLESKALKTETPEILDILREFTNTSPTFALYFFFIASFPKLAERLGLRQFSHRVEDFFTETIGNAISFREKNGVKRPDFLNMLINLMNRGTISDSGDVDVASKFSFKEALAQAFIFFIGGFETSSSALCFAIYFIAKFPDVQKRLRAEIAESKARHGGKLDYEALMEMKYLDQIFNETIRLYPPVPFIVRKAERTYNIPNSDKVIPEGTMIQVPIYSLNRDPEYWERPDDFHPDHFLPEQVAQRHPFAYLPFGDGPRNCIGMRFAQMQSKYALARLVEAFELTVSGKTQEPLTLEKRTANTSATGGVWVNFSKLE